MSNVSALFAGEVVHHRKRPKVHSLRYKVFSLLLDLDEVESLGKSLRLFAHNRWGIFSFHDADHGPGVEGGLRPWIEAELAKAGIESEGLKISALCYPRILGYVFNPLTVYFCRSGDGTLQAILYEVCNTFHERHAYVIPVNESEDKAVRHECAKDMYVSPFVPMDCRYSFRILPPEDEVLVAIHESDRDGPLLYASFAGKRQPLSDKTLMKALFAYPLMTLKIMGAIHWEALRLWLKGVPVYRHKKAATPLASTAVVTGNVMKGERT